MAGNGGVDLPQFVNGKRDGRNCQDLLHVGWVGGAWDRHDTGLMGQQPGK